MSSEEPKKTQSQNDPISVEVMQLQFMYSFQDCSQLHDSDTADEDSNTSSHDMESEDSDFNESDTEMMIMRKKAN